MIETLSLSPPGRGTGVRGVLVGWIFENWSLCGAWDLDIGISLVTG